MAVPQIKRTAYHEAAHCVAGHVLGLKITGATVIPRGETLGVCIADKFSGSLRSAVWAASGPVGEYLFLKSIGEKQGLPGAAGDWENLEKAVAAVIAEGQNVTYDLKPDRDDPTAVGTKEMADAIIGKIKSF